MLRSFKSLAGGKNIHGGFHVPRFSVFFHFLVVRNFCPNFSLQHPKTTFRVSPQIIAFISSYNQQDGNRMSFILGKTFELNNKLTLGLLCERGQYKRWCFSARCPISPFGGPGKNPSGGRGIVKLTILYMHRMDCYIK